MHFIYKFHWNNRTSSPIHRCWSSFNQSITITKLFSCFGLNCNMNSQSAQTKNCPPFHCECAEIAWTYIWFLFRFVYFFILSALFNCRLLLFMYRLFDRKPNDKKSGSFLVLLFICKISDLVLLTNGCAHAILQAFPTITGLQMIAIQSQTVYVQIGATQIKMKYS